MIRIPRDLEASLALVRHGESVYITEGRFQGQAENALSPLGERQAGLVGRRLAQPHRSPALPLPLGLPREIAHSPLGRTSQTANALADAISREHGVHVPLRPEPGAAEIAQGDWEGLHRDEVLRRYPELLVAWRTDPLTAHAPGGERVVDVQTRARTALQRSVDALAARSDASAPQPGGVAPNMSGYPGDPPASAPWSVLVAHDGVFKVCFLTLFDLPLDRFWSFPFALCGITVIEFRDGRPVLRLHNSTEHLAPLLDERSQAETEARQRSGAL